MRQTVIDRKQWEEARKILADHRKKIKEQLPAGWKQTTLFGPIQYEKTVRIGKKRYIGYLRSRWGYSFSVEIYERGRKYKLGKLIFEHKSVDREKDNPPLKSIRIIEREFRKMKEAAGKSEAARGKKNKHNQGEI